MKKYHEVWLETRSHRTKEWLEQRLQDGFDIHHLDGDHSNNRYDNLVLIDHSDHMMIHNGTTPMVLGRRTKGPTRRTLQRGAVAYLMRSQGKGWIEINRVMKTGVANNQSAKVYADMHGLPWPVQIG